MTESFLFLFGNPLSHAHNIAPFLVTKAITLVKKLFNTSNNTNTSIVLLIKNNSFTRLQGMITKQKLLLIAAEKQINNKTHNYQCVIMKFNFYLFYYLTSNYILYKITTSSYRVIINNKKVTNNPFFLISINCNVA